MADATPSWEQTDLLGLAMAAAPAAAAPEEPLEAAEPLEAPEPAEAAEPIEAMEPGDEEPPVRIAPPISLPGFTKSVARGSSCQLERLLVLDTETTALSPEQGECIEVGAVLFHVPGRAVLTQVSFLLPCHTNGAEAINGIPASVSQLEQPWREAQSCFLAMVAAADGILAHNAAFDRQWFGHGALPVLEKPWICSMEDIPWPADRQLRPNPSVRDLAIAYGVPVWAAHRALTDCTYLVQVLQRCDDLEALLLAAQEPRRLYRAQLPYNERHQAKAAGFRWNDPVPGAWSKRLSDRELTTLPFPVNPVLSA
ncbi:MAG: 3'-5' exonuclease [Cyanobium sp.]